MFFIIFRFFDLEALLPRGLESPGRYSVNSAPFLTTVPRLKAHKEVECSRNVSKVSSDDE
jgi:hypothetical protein